MALPLGPAPTGYGEYHLTEKGLDFTPVIIALTKWGDRWAAPEGPPINYQHDPCGGHVRCVLRCDGCESELAVQDVIARPTKVMARALQRRRAK